MWCHGMGWDVMWLGLARARSHLSIIDTDVCVLFCVCWLFLGMVAGVNSVQNQVSTQWSQKKFIHVDIWIYLDILPYCSPSSPLDEFGNFSLRTEAVGKCGWTILFLVDQRWTNQYPLKPPSLTLRLTVCTWNTRVRRRRNPFGKFYSTSFLGLSIALGFPFCLITQWTKRTKITSLGCCWGGGSVSGEGFNKNATNLELSWCQRIFSRLLLR